jgi:hypothetical protein
MPAGMFDLPPCVTVDLDDGRTDVNLFSYFPDEISFTPEEFIGLTLAEAYKLKTTKDVAYMQS